MSIEEIKRKHEVQGFITDDEAHDVITWLIAEVEKAQPVLYAAMKQERLVDNKTNTAWLEYQNACIDTCNAVEKWREE